MYLIKLLALSLFIISLLSLLQYFMLLHLGLDQWLGFYSYEFGIVLFVTSVICLLMGILFYHTWRINKTNEKDHLLALEQSRLAAIVDSSFDAIIGKTLDGTITSWNQAAERLYGYKSHEAIHQSIKLIVPDEKLPELMHIFKKIREGKYIPCFETLRKHKDGRFIPVSVVISPIKDLTSEIVGVSTIARDLSKQRLTEQKFQKTLEATPDAIVMVDREGKITFVNQQTKVLFGYEEDELLGQLVEVLIPEPYRSKHPEHRTHYFQSPRTRLMGSGMELYGLHKNGKEFPVEISLSPITTEEGLVTLAAVRDVTERKQAEERFKKILEATPDAIVMVDQTGKITFVNQQTKVLFGYEQDELLGQLVEVLIPEPYRSKHPEHRTHYFQSPRNRPMGSGMELYGLHKNGKQFPIEISLSPLETKEGIIALAAIRDITERKQIDKMKNEFISIVSHELKTPLTAIQGSLDLLMDGNIDQFTYETGELIMVAKKNSERLLRLINDILDVEKIELGKMEFHLDSIQLDTLIQEAIKANQPYAEKFKVNIYYIQSLPDIIVKVDHDRMIQVLTNLLSNAIQFSPKQGKVTIKMVKANNRVKVEIHDQGPGVPEEFQSRIFQKFAQADSSITRKQGGTGLGLSISKAIIEKLNGNISFETTPSVGATFYFDLPINNVMEPA